VPVFPVRMRKDKQWREALSTLCKSDTTVTLLGHDLVVHSTKDRHQLVTKSCEQNITFVTRYNLARFAAIIRLNTYADDTRGKIVITQLYYQVKANKSSKTCIVAVRKQRICSFHPLKDGYRAVFSLL